MPLSKFRRSAERYCKIMGLDPEAMIEHITPEGSSAKAPQWEVIAAKIRKEFAMAIAVANQPL